MAAPLPVPDDFHLKFAELDGNVTHLAEHYGRERSVIRRWRSQAWEVVGASVSASGGVSTRLRPAQDPVLVLPVRSDGWKAPKRPPVQADAPRTWALFSDIHCPFHSEELLEKACAWLADVKPTDGIFNGDVVDYPDVSKYAKKEDWAASVNECNQAAYRYLRACVAASPETRWIMHPGNHEARLPHYIQQYARGVFGIRPAGDSEFAAWHDLRNLLRLDELGIELHSDAYPEAETAITPNFVVTHGDHTKKRSGNSAHAALDEADHSFAQGHDHRLAFVFRTKWGADKRPSVHMGVQAGTMADVDVRGLGYAKKPDWQQGFAVVNTWPDGLFSAELAVFVKGQLLYRNRRY